MTAKKRERDQSKNRPFADFKYGEGAGRLGLGDDPMTSAQASYLKHCLKNAMNRNFQADLTKAEASKCIDALKAKRSPVRHR